jgi:hypothetical protein
VLDARRIRGVAPTPIAGLAEADREAALQILKSWTGVAPQKQVRTPGQSDPARVAWLRGMRR